METLNTFIFFETYNSKKGTYSCLFMVPLATRRLYCCIAVGLLSILSTLILDGGELFTSRPSRFNPGTEDWYNWARGSAALEPVCRLFRRGKSLALTEIKTLDHPARSLTPVPTMLSELHAICWISSLFRRKGKKRFVNIKTKKKTVM
jgi:hypothetical protein